MKKKIKVNLDIFSLARLNRLAIRKGKELKELIIDILTTETKEEPNK